MISKKYLNLKDSSGLGNPDNFKGINKDLKLMEKSVLKFYNLENNE